MNPALNRRSFFANAVGFATAFAVANFEAQANESDVHEIAIKDFEFEPSVLIVRPGDTIRWINHDIAPHTATADDNSWNTGRINGGESSFMSVKEGMKPSYFCSFHPHMKASLELVS